MHDQKSSRTALRVAMRRAAHQLLDAPKIFDDPLALSILGAEELSRLRAEISGDERDPYRSLRAFMAVRSRYSEDQLARAVDAGVRQYVVLGAGLDTFAYRNSYAALGLRVFEVDHPSTQEFKRNQLIAAGVAVPELARFVAVNFEQQSLGLELEANGFRTNERAFFSCMGVVPYLTDSAFSGTMGYIARMARGSGVVFDYAVPKSSLSEREQLRLEALAGRVAAAGEPLRLFLEPEELGRQLRNLGFSDLEDLGVEEINARYFSDRSDGLQVASSLGRLMRAEL